MDIASVGEILIDFMPGREPEEYICKAGGAPANMVIAAARRGLDCGFCGKVGDDHFGAFLHRVLVENKVQILSPKRLASAVTTMAFVSLAADGERSFTFVRKPGADMFLTEADIDSAGVCNYKLINAGSCSLSEEPAAGATLYALRQAGAHSRLRAFDLNYRELLWGREQDRAQSKIDEALSSVDFLKISDEELTFVGGEEQIFNVMNDKGISAVIRTHGAHGSSCYWQGKVLFEAGIPSQTVDTTGAGDAFWGNFLATLILAGVQTVKDLTAEIIHEALRCGNIAGALCVRKKGAIDSLPYAEDIAKFQG